MASFVMLDGPESGRLLAVEDGAVIGRGELATALIRHSSLSRKHATITRRDGLYVLRDSSANGTFVNGVAITEAVLADGDLLRFGNVTVQFLAGASDDPVG